MKKKLFKDIRGFTLIELMVVMAIIAVLAVLIIAAINAARTAAADTTRRSNGKSIQVALEAYFAAQPTKIYPTASMSSLDDLTTSTSTINGFLASYLNPKLTDPQTGASGWARYCYAQSRTGYVLGVQMANTTGTLTCNVGSGSTAGTVANGESFSVNP